MSQSISYWLRVIIGLLALIIACDHPEPRRMPVAGNESFRYRAVMRPYMMLAMLAFCAGCTSESAKSTSEGTALPSEAIANPQGPASSSESTSENLATWIDAQLKPHDAFLDRIVDEQPWARSPVPNTHLILGIAKRRAKNVADAAQAFDSFAFVLMLESDAKETLKGPRMRGLFFPDWAVGPPGPYNDNTLKALDLNSIQIREDEYTFGIRFTQGIAGRLSTVRYEVLSLFRYHEGELQEIFRDVVWAYLQIVDDVERTCAVEAAIVAQRSQGGDFFRLTREHRKSASDNATNTSTPTECHAFPTLEQPRRHTWNPKAGRYLDERGRFLPWDFAGKPSF